MNIATPVARLKRVPIWLKGAPRTHGRILILLLALALAQGLALTLGIVAGREEWPEKAWRRVSPLFERIDNTQTVRWREIALNQHTLDWSVIRIGPPRRGGGLVEVNGHIVFATPRGHFNYLSRDLRLAPMDLRAPLHLDELGQSSLARAPLFDSNGVRVHDLLARPLEDGRWELYASFSRYGGENCFQFVVARTILDASRDSVRATSRTWRDVYVARPGCIRYKDRSWRFVGEAAGGRMQLLDHSTMLVSIGDHQFDGINDSHNAPMDPDWDLGKLVALDLETGGARIVAMGVRNPQGLLVMRDGRVIETEHGPQGGDEINLIRDGANYGWPHVTYGLNYGFPRRPWADDPSPGGHGGYERPMFAFVPAIGVSNLVQPGAAEFPLWSENDLLVGSMRARTLFHVRLHGENVAYVEPISFGDHRLRDIIALSDGRVAMLTDSGNIILVRNAERHSSTPRSFTVQGLLTLHQDVAWRSRPSGPQRGREMFMAGCANCHSLDGEIGVGPPLNGVLGRRIGSVAGFGYSPALSDQSGSWSANLLMSYAIEPSHRFPGTTMPPATVSWSEMPNIVAFLRTTRARDRGQGGAQAAEPAH